MRRLPVVGVVGLLLLLPVAVPPAPDRGPAVVRSATADSLAASTARFTVADSLVADALPFASTSDSFATAGGIDLTVADPPPARDYLAEVRAGFTPETRAYAGTRVVLACLGPIFAVLLMLAFLFSGFSARLRDIAHQMGHRRYVRVLVYLALFLFFTALLTLPFEWYRGFALEHQYGLSNQTLGAWLGDQLKDLGFTLVVLGVIPLLALGYGAIERYPRTWWLWLAGGSVPVIVLTVLLSPLVYDPSFNKVEPLSDPALREEILDLAAKSGIPSRHVYQVDRSRQTKKYNAYVSGFGASQRIVLWDTMLQGMERDEILFVMGHEMGHYRLRHIWKGIAFEVVLSLLGFFLLARIVSSLLRRFGAAWHVRSLDDVATVPLFVMAGTLVLVLLQPMTAAFSRAVEHEADVFAVEVTRDNDAGARAFLALATQNRNNPDPPPLVKLWLYNHPPLAERIRFALDYRPWERGMPNRYFHPAP